jgi:hypothetical protein
MTVEIYTGLEDPKEWLSFFDSLAYSKNWSDYEKAIVATQMMRGKAQEWCESFCSKVTGPLCWKRFKGAFLKKFSLSSNKIMPAKADKASKKTAPKPHVQQPPEPAKQWDFVPKKGAKKGKRNFTNAWAELRRLRQDLCVKEYIQNFELLASKCDIVDEIDIVKARMFVTGLTFSLRKKVVDHGYSSYAEARSLSLEYDDSSTVNRDMQIAGLIHRVTETLKKVQIELFSRHNASSDSNSKEGKEKSSETVVCYFCSETGHFSEECPSTFN